MKKYGYGNICQHMDDLKLGRMNCILLNFKNYAKIPIIKTFNETQLSLISCKQICIKLKTIKIERL